MVFLLNKTQEGSLDISRKIQLSLFFLGVPFSYSIAPGLLTLYILEAPNRFRNVYSSVVPCRVMASQVNYKIWMQANELI